MAPKTVGSKLPKELDPEVIMKQKFRAKCLFRALGRRVKENVYWLIDDVDEYEGLEDVKRRVQQAVRGRTKKNKLLSIRDKALLNKPADERTEQEKKYIYRIIGGLKCFKKYPNHVKKKLAAVTYYKYFSPGRVIVREHQEAYALYFIVSGDVVVTQMMFDEIIEEHVSVELGHMTDGDMFGEVSLLHNIPRTATVTTVDHSECLTLLAEDFKNVLQVSIQKQWDKVQNAMSVFTYFETLDDVARREGCIVARMRSYEENETLLGDGAGVANFVYFILAGRCRMIESMNIFVNTRMGKTFYKLYDPYVTKEKSEEDIDKKYFNFNVQSKENQPSNINSADKESEPKLPANHAVLVHRVSHSQSILKRSSASDHTKSSSPSEGVQLYIEDEENREPNVSIANVVPVYDSALRKSQVILPPSPSNQWHGRESVRLSVIPEVTEEKPPPNLKTYFMQVCEFNPGSTFGFGENMRDRRIIALTRVDCLLLPKIWLMQRNTANIWTRIQYYLEKKSKLFDCGMNSLWILGVPTPSLNALNYRVKSFYLSHLLAAKSQSILHHLNPVAEFVYIPNKEKLFEEFVGHHRWLEYREQVVNDVVARSKTVNSTSVHDVPYCIRMEEMLDI